MHRHVFLFLISVNLNNFFIYTLVLTEESKCKYGSIHLLIWSLILFFYKLSANLASKRLNNVERNAKLNFLFYSVPNFG